MGNILLFIIFLTLIKKMRPAKMKSLGDGCWDRICPMSNKEQKLNCLREHRADICRCCSSEAEDARYQKFEITIDPDTNKEIKTPLSSYEVSSSDCNILIPGYGIDFVCGAIPTDAPYASPAGAKALARRMNATEAETESDSFDGLSTIQIIYIVVMVLAVIIGCGIVYWVFFRQTGRVSPTDTATPTTSISSISDADLTE